MLSRLKGWYYGWKATLSIRFFEPELYRRLKEPLEIRDLGEVRCPGDD